MLCVVVCLLDAVVCGSSFARCLLLVVCGCSLFVVVWCCGVLFVACRSLLLVVVCCGLLFVVR